MGAWIRYDGVELPVHVTQPYQSGRTRWAVEFRDRQGKPRQKHFSDEAAARAWRDGHRLTYPSAGVVARHTVREPAVAPAGLVGDVDTDTTLAAVTEAITEAIIGQARWIIAIEEEEARRQPLSESPHAAADRELRRDVARFVAELLIAETTTVQLTAAEIIAAIDERFPPGLRGPELCRAMDLAVEYCHAIQESGSSRVQ
jgi:hypothetical protein